MPTKKKKSKCDCSCCGHDIYKEVHKMGDEVVSMVKDAKNKFDKSDEKTKKKIITGIAGAGALIAGAIGLSKLKKKK